MFPVMLLLLYDKYDGDVIQLIRLFISDWS